MKLHQNCIHLVQLNGSMLKASTCNNVNFGLNINKYATGIDINIKANNSDDELKTHCYHTSGNSFESTIKDDGSYYTDVYNNKKKVGYLSGNYKKGEVSVDIKNILIKQNILVQIQKEMKQK